MRGRIPSAVQGRDRQTGGVPPVPAEVRSRDRPQAINPGAWGGAPLQRSSQLLLIRQFLSNAGMRSDHRI